MFEFDLGGGGSPVRDRRSDRARRRAIRNIEPLRDERVVYSRGRYVYALDLKARSGTIVFESRYTVKDLSHANGRLVVANADVLVLEM